MTTTLTLHSPAFDTATRIPRKHTCDGLDTSPPLSWTAGPADTRTYALIMDDPDAPMGTWVHWVAWNISGTNIPESAPRDPRLPDGMRQGKNSWRRAGYGGPCPPSGEHRYFFRIYALDAELELPDSTDKERLVAAMEGHTLATGELMGTYARGK